MTSTASTSNSAAGPIMLGVIVVVFGVFGAGAAYSLGPRGERVGAIELTAPAPLTVNLAAPSALSFRLDATLPLPTDEPSGRSRRNAAYDRLGESRLVLTVTREGAAPRVIRCAAYDGRFVSASDTSTEVAMSGVPLTCALADASAGRYVITAQATWARNMRVRHASLEVRAATR